MLKPLPSSAPVGAPIDAPKQDDAEQAHALPGLELLEEHSVEQPVDSPEDLEAMAEEAHEVLDGVQHPEEAGAERVESKSANNAVLMAEASGGQGQLPKPVPSPRVPTREEYERHVLTHIPFRNWCRHCVSSRKPNIAHKNRRRCAERSTPLLAINC